MTNEQVHLAGAIVAVFAAIICGWQMYAQRAIHYLWLLILLVGIVCWAVTR